jgi:hypothetical protein
MFSLTTLAAPLPMILFGLQERTNAKAANGSCLNLGVTCICACIPDWPPTSRLFQPMVQPSGLCLRSSHCFGSFNNLNVARSSASVNSKKVERCAIDIPRPWKLPRITNGVRSRWTARNGRRLDGMMRAVRGSMSSPIRRSGAGASYPQGS